MSDDRIKIKQALRVFYEIREQGKKINEDEYMLSGLRASSDYDGYTVRMQNDYVALDIFFHNSYKLNSSSNTETDKFLDTINKIDKAAERRREDAHQ